MILTHTHIIVSGYVCSERGLVYQSISEIRWPFMNDPFKIHSNILFVIIIIIIIIIIIHRSSMTMTNRPVRAKPISPPCDSAVAMEIEIEIRAISGELEMSFTMQHGWKKCPIAVGQGGKLSRFSHEEGDEIMGKWSENHDQKPSPGPIIHDLHIQLKTTRATYQIQLLLLI